MAASHFLANALRPRFAGGLSLTLLSDGQFTADFCLLERRGEEVVMTDQAVGLRSAADIKAQVHDRNVRIALAVHGRGVLHRRLPNAAANLPESVRNLLPGASLDDFYVQVMGEQAEQYISLIRQEQLHQLLAGLSESQLFVTDVTLGPFRFINLLPYLEPEEISAALEVDGYRFKAQVDPPLLREVSYQPKPRTVNDAVTLQADVTGERTLAYALALTLFHTEPYDSLLPLALLNNRREWRQRFWHPVLLCGVLGLVFTILLANFFVFSYLSSQSQEVVSQDLSAKAQAASAERLQQELVQKEKFLRTTGWLEPSHHSVRADELAASLPSGIQLLTLDSHPVDAPATQIQHRQTFKSGVIFLKGQCHDPMVLNTWLQRLEHLSWVKSVREQTFAQDYAAGVGTFSFVLILK